MCLPLLGAQIGKITGSSSAIKSVGSEADSFEVSRSLGTLNLMNEKDKVSWRLREQSESSPPKKEKPGCDDHDAFRSATT